MKASAKIRLTIYAFGFAGAALFTVLVARQGFAAVGSAIETARWAILGVIAFHLLSLFCDGIAWWALFPNENRPRLLSLYWMRWIGESISNLVPSAQVGGDIVRARLAAILYGTPLPIAAGTVLADITLGVFTQIVFTLLGLGLLVNATGHTNMVGPILLGAAVGVFAIGGFYVVQRLGMFRLIGLIVSKLASSPDWHSLVTSGETLDQTVRAIYSRISGVVVCCSITLVSLCVASAEVWIVLYVLGIHATFATGLILQSVSMGIRSALFPVPGAIGVQESGYLVVGNLLGIPGDTALALSLISRVRELALGIPGLVVWQLVEGRRLWRARLAGTR